MVLPAALGGVWCFCLGGACLRGVLERHGREKADGSSKIYRSELLKLEDCWSHFDGCVECSSVSSLTVHLPSSKTQSPSLHSFIILPFLKKVISLLSEVNLSCRAIALHGVAVVACKRLQYRNIIIMAQTFAWNFLFALCLSCHTEIRQPHTNHRLPGRLC